MKKTVQSLLLAAVFVAIVSCFAATAYILRCAQDPEHQLEKLLINSDKGICKAFFSPDDNVRSVLIKLIQTEQEKIITAMYTLTEKEIAGELLEAYKRGVELELVVDRGYGVERASKIPKLANHHIPIWVYQCTDDETQSSLMHNKFFVFKKNILDKTIVWTGSYNATQRASTRNQENVVVLDCPDLGKQFIDHFEKLKTRSLLISGRKGDTQNEYSSEHKRPEAQRVKDFFKKIDEFLGGK